MDILLDNIIFSLQRTGGISVYWSELLRGLRVNNTVRLLERPEALHNIQRRALAIQETACIRETSFLPVQISRYLPVRLALPPRSIFHSSYYRIACTPGVINIVTVHDFIYERYTGGLRRMVHSLQKGFAIRHADMIICNSEQTRQDLLHFHPDTNPDKIQVIPMAASDEFGAVPPTTPLPSYLKELEGKPYLLYVGDRSSYKHFPVAVETVGQFPGAMLMIVGGKPLSPDERRLLQMHISGRYHHLHETSAAELNLLYTHAWCLLYPSAYEGFGIPPLEAMQAGCPVIAVNTASLPEVCGDAALLAAKPCAEEFVRLARLLDIPATRAALKVAGQQRARLFSWNLTCAKTCACYETALHRRRKKP